MKGSLKEDENFFMMAVKPSIIRQSCPAGRREQASRFGRLFGAGAVWQGLGGNVGQVVGVRAKPLPASKEGQHTVCPLTVDKKPVVSTGWGRNREGAWSKILGSEAGDRLACKRLRSLRLFTLVSENRRQLASKRRAAGFLRQIRYLGYRGTARGCKNNRQGCSPGPMKRVRRPGRVKQIGHGAEV